MSDNFDMPLDLKAQLDGVATAFSGEKVRSKPAYLSGISAAALMTRHFDPIRYIVEGYIVEGLTVLAGAPKARKSWLMLDVAIAVASDGEAFGSIPCEVGDVLYLALEDNFRRLQDRLQRMGVSDAPGRLTLCTSWPTGNDAVAEIEEWAHSAERPVLVVVDVLARVREFTGREAKYDDDYRALVALQDLASQLGIAIVVVHHTRKAGADDPFDEVSGTRGITGVADTVLVIRRDNSGGQSHRATLYGRGRDIPEIETAIEFSDADFRWQVLGEAWRVADTVEQQQILELLQANDEAMKLKDIAEALGKERSNVGNMLRKMVDAQLITKPATGSYAPMKTMKAMNVEDTDSQDSSFSSPPDSSGEWNSEKPDTCPRCDGIGCGWCERACDA